VEHIEQFHHVPERTPFSQEFSMNENNNSHIPPKRLDFQFKQPLKSHREVSSALSEEFDKLNAQWKEAEQQLASLHTPVHCDEVYARHDPDPRDLSKPMIEHRLAWTKDSEGEWHICYAIAPETHNYDEVVWRAIKKAPLEVRIEAVPAFPKLYDKLLDKAREYVDRVKGVTSSFAIDLL
jgi:hypothetical protein